jgi:hypothetical protein
MSHASSSSFGSSANDKEDALLMKATDDELKSLLNRRRMSGAWETDANPRCLRDGDKYEGVWTWETDANPRCLRQPAPGWGYV